jgi:3-hydroxyisobutyrate dehydrogenase
MKIAFIGMGTMGVGMAMNILKAGHEVTVHNRTREKEESLAAEGAGRAASPKEAASGAEIIVICVSDTPDVEGIILGDEGVIHGAPEGSIVIDMSTISPTATRLMADLLAKKGISMLDAPVSGGPEGAQNGTLAIMVGGEAAVFEKALPILDVMGKTVTHVGSIGAGQITKAINQIMITGTYLTMAEGLTIGKKYCRPSAAVPPAHGCCTIGAPMSSTIPIPWDSVSACTIKISISPWRPPVNWEPPFRPRPWWHKLKTD